MSGQIFKSMIMQKVHQSIKVLSHNSINLYDASRALIQERNISVLTQKVISHTAKNHFEIKTDESIILSDWVFDSRPRF